MEIITLTIKVLTGLVMGIGAYMIFADIFKIPTINTSKAINNIAKKQKDTTSFLDVILGNSATFLAKHIKLNEFKRQSLEADLRTAQIDTTPEMFKANALVKGLFAFVLALPFLFTKLFFVGLVLMFVGVILYFVSSKSVSGRIKVHRLHIENDLPRLVGTVQKKLTHERGIIGIIESFIPSAGPELAHELEITVADMRSGNEEAAVTRLEARVGSPMMSDVCRGFITMIHGDVAEVYWSSIAQKFSDIQRNRLRAEANKIPGKVRRLSMCMLICFLLIFLVVIAVEIIDSLGLIFG